MKFTRRRLRRLRISSAYPPAGHILLTHDHMELLFDGIEGHQKFSIPHI